MFAKIKVIHIITRLDKGGSAENTYLTLKGMDKSRYEVSLVTGPVEDPSQDRRNQIEESGVQYIQIPQLRRNINLFHDFTALLRIYRFLKREKPDIVHTHTSKAGLLGRLAAKLAGVPSIIHTPHGHVFFGYFGALKTRIFILLEKFASRITDKIVALTPREKADYLSYKVVEEDKLAVIPSGIELHKYQQVPQEERSKLRKELGIPENSAVLGTAGRLVPVKGPEFLLQAVGHVISEYPDTYLVFAGDGPLRKSLEKNAVEMGLAKNIIFTGWRDDMARVLSIFDIFCLPSLNEGMGRVLLEAMALGKPIVASDVGGIPDLIIPGKNGFLVPPQHPEELAKQILFLIENREEREKLGRTGKEMVSAFSDEIMMKKIAELYEKLVNPNHS
jgi:glycosyltransferase involved in cell wall biosynthesis